MNRKAKLPFDPKAFLLESKRRRTYFRLSEGSDLFRQGDPADAVFYIQSGRVKKTIVSEQGKEAVVALLGAADFFGEGSLAGEALRLATVSALTKCTIARISKADITRVIHEEPAFAELFVSHLLARNSRVERTWLINCSIRARNVWRRTLLLLANFGEEGRRNRSSRKSVRKRLQEMIGTTRSRVSFFMNKFRKLGLIDYNGSIEIHSSLLNVVLRDQPRIRS